MTTLTVTVSPVSSSSAAALLEPTQPDRSVVELASIVFRRLQQRNNDADEATVERGRTVLTVLYLIVLGLCCITPVIYYCRIYWEERQNVHLREASRRILSAHTQAQRDETRAARRKLLDERRARILHLLSPVRMVLRDEHFPHLQDKNFSETHSPNGETAAITTNEGGEADAAVLPSDVEMGGEMRPLEGHELSTPINQQDEEAPAPATIPVVMRRASKEVSKFNSDSSEFMYGEDYGEDDESRLVRIPQPGIFWKNKSPQPSTESRLAPALCTICLSSYKVGDDIVWSSNESCEHAYHAGCMERWLLKQREGPLCPCCRRDFIVDPYDVEEVDGADTPNDPENPHAPRSASQTLSNGDGEDGGSNQGTDSEGQRGRRPGRRRPRSILTWNWDNQDAWL